MSTPPKLFHQFFRWYCHPRLLDHIEGDLLEDYGARLKRHGKWRADVKFCWDVLLLFRSRIIRPLSGYQQVNNYGMLKNYFTVGWRNIVRSKGYSFINVSGLAIGLAATILILLWVQNEISYDRFHANAGRIHQLYSRDMNNGKVDVWGNTPALLAPELKQSYGEVEDAVRQRIVFFLLKVGENRFNEAGAFADPGFLSMFSFPVLKGPVRALQDDFGIVLTRSMAVKLFGTVDCLGQTVLVNDHDNFKVSAVMEDLPRNTNFEFGYLLPWNYMTRLGWDSNQSWAWTNAGTFVLLKDERSAASFNAKITDLVKRHVKEGDGSTREVFAHPLTKVYLYNRAENGSLTGGRIETIRMFSGIAGLIVLIACINFMNLSTARSEKRAREVGVRKIAGAIRSSLVLQFLVESILLVMLAFAASVLLVKLSLPLFNEVVNTTLHLDLMHPPFWIVAAAIILTTGIAAGSYPAFFLSSYQPINALKGTFKKLNSPVNPRKILVVVQFTTAIALCLCAIMVQQQVQYAQDRDAGYDPKHVSYEFMQGQIPAHFEAIKNELVASGAVTSVTRTYSPVVRIWGLTTNLTWQGSDQQDKSINFLEFGADADMAKTFGMEILDGRDLDIYHHPTDTGAVVLNQSAVAAMRLAKPVGEVIRDGSGKNWEIVGVIKDFITESPYQKIEPMIIKGWQDRYGVMNYRFSAEGDVMANRTKAELVFKKNNPDYPFECISAESNYLRKFSLEKQTGTLASWFAGLTILISCLGLFGLAAYMAETRTKEVGVRKILGASTTRITLMLSLDFLKLVLLAIVVATPLAWYVITGWLESFNYRVPMSIGIFILAGIMALMVAMLTVSTQAIRAATANPVKSLRSE